MTYLSTARSYLVPREYAIRVAVLDPTALPVSVEEMRDRVGAAPSHDAILRQSISAVTQEFEMDIQGTLRLSQVEQIYSWRFGTVEVLERDNAYTWWSTEPWRVNLDLWPVVGPVSMQYLDKDGNPQPFTGFTTALSYQPAFIRVQDSLPQDVQEVDECWTVSYQSGFQEVPELARLAIMQRVADDFMGRSVPTEEAMYWQQAIRNFRAGWF